MTAAVVRWRRHEHRTSYVIALGVLPGARAVRVCVAMRSARERRPGRTPSGRSGRLRYHPSTQTRAGASSGIHSRQRGVQGRDETFDETSRLGSRPGGTHGEQYGKDAFLSREEHGTRAHGHVW